MLLPVKDWASILLQLLILQTRAQGHNETQEGISGSYSRIYKSLRGKGCATQIREYYYLPFHSFRERAPEAKKTNCLLSECLFRIFLSTH